MTTRIQGTIALPYDEPKTLMFQVAAAQAGLLASDRFVFQTDLAGAYDFTLLPGDYFFTHYSPSQSASMARRVSVPDTATITLEQLQDPDYVAPPPDVVETNTAPVVSSLVISLLESQAQGVVAQVAAVDADSDPLTYAIAAGNAAGDFSVDVNTGELSLVAALDYATTPSYALTVDVSDGTDTTQTSVTITVVPDTQYILIKQYTQPVTVV